jgi:hypothetical protein
VLVVLSHLKLLVCTGGAPYKQIQGFIKRRYTSHKAALLSLYCGKYRCLSVWHFIKFYTKIREASFLYKAKHNNVIVDSKITLVLVIMYYICYLLLSTFLTSSLMGRGNIDSDNIDVIVRIAYAVASWHCLEFCPLHSVLLVFRLDFRDKLKF